MGQQQMPMGQQMGQQPLVNPMGMKMNQGMAGQGGYQMPQQAQFGMQQQQFAAAQQQFAGMQGAMPMGGMPNQAMFQQGMMNSYQMPQQAYQGQQQGYVPYNQSQTPTGQQGMPFNFSQNN